MESIEKSLGASCIIPSATNTEELGYFIKRTDLPWVCLKMGDINSLPSIMSVLHKRGRRAMLHHDSVKGIANSAALILDKTLAQVGAFRNNTPKVLFICPPPLGPVENGVFGEMFKGNVEKSTHLAEFFKANADLWGVPFFDAGAYVHASDKDGLHMMDDQHKILGEALAAVVKQMDL